MLRLPPIPTDTDTLFPSTKRFRSKLPDEVRSRYDTSTLKVAIHAAAPCPVPVKQAMIDWWGPVLFEYYAGSEGNGMTFISSADWLTHRGSVGRPILGAIHKIGRAHV